MARRKLTVKSKLEKLVTAEINTRKAGRRKIVHILDIDEVTTREEIEGALREVLPDNDYKVLSLRPARRGTQNASVELNEEAAAKILNQGKIRVGWIRCRVRERIEIPRCYKCQELGHLRSQCAGPDRTDLCLKCGEGGHRAKNCDKEAKLFCFSCNEEGHRNDSSKCPRFRKLLDGARAVVRSRKKDRRKTKTSLV